jgi:hypothetical protein
MSKFPEFLPYFDIKPIDQVSGLIGVYCYVIEYYKPGFAVLIKRDGEKVIWQARDWDGEELVCDSAMWQAAVKHITTLTGVMSYAGIPQSEYYFDADNNLVDMRQSLNKFASPGMLRDLFTKCIGTQKVVEVAIMTAEKIQELKDMGKSYIIKPSRYRFHTVDDTPEPLYAYL